MPEEHIISVMGTSLVLHHGESTAPFLVMVFGCTILLILLAGLSLSSPMILAVLLISMSVSFAAYVRIKGDWESHTYKPLNLMSLSAGIILAMCLTAFIGPLQGVLTDPLSIPVLSYLRAFLWLFALSYIPGALLLKLLRVELPGIFLKSSVCISLSLFIVMAFTIVANSVGALELLPSIFLAFLAGECICVLMRGGLGSGISWSRESLWEMAPYAMIAGALLLLAGTVELSQKYMIPGDMWAVVKPATLMLNGQQVYTIFLQSSYPITFGHLILGLSIGAGLPIVNTYTLLFPLVLLNMFAFLALVRDSLHLGRLVAIMGSVLYLLGGGWGILLSWMKFSKPVIDWNIGALSYDLWQGRAWLDVFFYDKTLSISLAILSLALLLSKSGHRRWILGLAMVLAVFSLEVYLLPIFCLGLVFVAYLLEHWRFRGLVSFLGGGIVLFLALDSFMSWYYLQLIPRELRFNILPTLLSIPYWAIFGIPVTATILIVLWWKGAYQVFWTGLQRQSKRLKRLSLSLLLAIFAISDGFVIYAAMQTPLVTPVVLVSIIASFGIVKYLGVIGIWDSSLWNSTKDLLIWGLFAALFSEALFPSRAALFIFPALAALGGIGMARLVLPVASTLSISQVSENVVRRSVAIKLLWPAVAVSGIVLLLASSSVVATACYLVSNGGISTTDAALIEWVHANVKADTPILLSYSYNLYEGIEALDGWERSNIFLFNSQWSSEELVGNLTEIRPSLMILSAQDALVLGGLNGLLPTIFKTGQYSVIGLPHLDSPSSPPHLLGIKGEILGSFWPASQVAWMDDTMNGVYIVTNTDNDTEFSSNNETLTVEWPNALNQSSGPTVTWVLTPPVSSTGLTFDIRYTLSGPGQAKVVLSNSSEWPNNFVTSGGLISGTEFHDTYLAMPPSNNVSSFYIWLTSSPSAGGMTTLEIDYVCLLEQVENQSRVSSEDQVSALALLLPSVLRLPYQMTDMNGSNSFPTARVAVLPFHRSQLEFIQNSLLSVFILVNASADVPDWGSNWTLLEQGLVSGQFAGKTVIIVSPIIGPTLDDLAARLQSYLG